MKKEKLIKFHQGDVIGQQLSELPANAKKIENRPIAYGEHSGHQHILTGDVEMFEIDVRMVAVVGGDGARLQHIHESDMTPIAWKKTNELKFADHKSHLLPKGIYQFDIHKTYNPYEKIMEKVID